MRFLPLIALCLFSTPSPASWHYNENAGFGIFQPEGWSSRINGRSSLLSGPATDTDRSRIFLGSDWISRVTSAAELERYAEGEAAGRPVQPVLVSTLPAFRVGSELAGVFFVLRSPGNVIVIEYELRGSAPQLEEGATMLGSVEIRTRGIENEQ